MIGIFMESPKCIIIFGKEIFVCDLLSRFGRNYKHALQFPRKEKKSRLSIYTSFCPPTNRYTQAFI